MYEGVRFKVIFEEEKQVDNEKLADMVKWGKQFYELGLTPKEGGGYAGNLSFRTSDGFVITAAGADLGNLTKKDFSEVIGVDMTKKEIFVKGLKEPSSESFLHNEVYQRRQDTNTVFHGHDKIVLDNNNKLRLPITEKEQPYGTIELMLEVVKTLNNHNYLLIKNHGFISLGKTMDGAGKEALRQHNNALALSKLNL